MQKSSVFRAIKLMLLLFFLVHISSCADEQPRLPALRPGQVIVAFGDSLTYGVGAAENDSYPAILEKLSGFRVINAGVSGDTTEKSLSRLPVVLAEYQPALVILCIGGNDMLRRKNNDEIAENLNELIRIIQSGGASVVLIAEPEPNVLMRAPEFYQTVAAKNRVPVDMTVLPKLMRSPDYKSDTIHLNKAGYEALAKGVFAFLKEQGAIS